MMARNRCLLAQKTMEALSMITNDTWRPFVVESIVQRMANMLNYVLKLLVGAKSRELKVCLLRIDTVYYCSVCHSFLVGQKCSSIEL